MESSRLLTQDKYDVVISGMGPAGLATAWEALRAGKSVCFINDREREKYTRGQKVFLEKQVRERLIAMYNTIDRTHMDPLDIEINNAIFKDPFISINLIEQFLYRRVMELAHLQQIPLEILDKSKVEHIDLKKGVAVVTGENVKEVVGFNFFIGADGVHHPSLNVLNESYPEKERIKHTRDFKFKLHKYHFNSVVSIPKELLPDKFFSNLSKQKFNIRVKDDLYYYVQFAEDSKGNVNCTINAEVPRELYNAYHLAKAELQAESNDKTENEFKKAKLQLLDFMNSILNDELGKEKKIQIEEKQLLTLNTFTTILMQADKSFKLEETQDGQFVYALVGDAYRSPYYPLGHGINFALDEAAKMQEVFKCKPKELTQRLKGYDQFCQSLASEVKFPVVLGSIFKKTIWEKSNKGINDLFTEHRNRSMRPPAHNAFREKKINEATLKKHMESGAIYSLNINRQNILHEASFEAYIWLRNNQPEAFVQLLHKVDKDGNSPLHYLFQSTPVNQLQYLFNENFISKFADDNGRTFAHLMTHADADFKALSDKIKWFIKIDPSMFAKPDKDNKTAVDLYIQRYLTHSSLNIEYFDKMNPILKDLQQALTVNYPNESIKIGDAIKKKEIAIQKTKELYESTPGEDTKEHHPKMGKDT